MKMIKTIVWLKVFIICLILSGFETKILLGQTNLVINNSNLLANTGFEEGAQGWRIDSGTEFTEDAHQGKKAVKNSPGYLVAAQDLFHVKDVAGKIYECSAFIKGESEAQAGFALVYINRAGEKIEGYFKKDWKFSVTGEYKEYKFHWKAPDNADKLYRLHFYRANRTGTIYYDDIVFREVSGESQLEISNPVATVEKHKDTILCEDVSQLKADGYSGTETKTAVSSEQLRNGKKTLKVFAKFPTNWTGFSLWSPKMPLIPVSWGRLALWAKGDPDLNGKIRVSLVDADGETYKGTVATSISYPDWTKYVVNLQSDLSLVPSTRVNGKIDPPLKIKEFLVQSRVPGEATLYFSDIMLDAQEAELIYSTYDFCAISPDISSPFALALNYHFDKEVPPYTDLILELPPEVDVSSWAGLSFEPPKKEKVERGGESYVRWTFRREGPGHHHARDGKGLKDIRFYLTTQKESGILNGYYYLRYGNVETEPKRIKLPVIRIPKTAPPQRLITVMDLATFGREPLKTWPGAVSNVKRLGMKAGVLGMAMETSSETVQKLKQEAEVYQNADIEVMSRIGGWTLGCHLLTDPDSHAEDINAQKLNHPCYSQRKKGFMEAVANGKGVIDAGVYQIQFDDEYPLVCFCSTCCQRFQNFLKECEPSLSYVDPHIFEKEPEKYPGLHQAWIEFGLWNYAQAILDFRKELKTHMRAKGLDPELLVLGDDAHDAIIDSHHAIKAYEQAFDWYGEQIYITEYGQFKGNPWLAGERVAKIKEKLKNSRLKIIPTLTTGQIEFSGPAGDLQPPKLMLYQILESFMAGADGISVYDYGDIDLMEMKYMADAIRTILPVEEMIIQGKVTDKAKLIEGGANIRALEDKGEFLVLVSDYTIKNPKEVRIRLETIENFNIIDLDTGALIGKLSKKNKIFSVKLTPAEMAKMFYLKKA